MIQRCIDVALWVLAFALILINGFFAVLFILYFLDTAINDSCDIYFVLSTIIRVAISVALLWLGVYLSKANLKKKRFPIKKLANRSVQETHSKAPSEVTQPDLDAVSKLLRENNQSVSSYSDHLFGTWDSRSTIISVFLALVFVLCMYTNIHRGIIYDNLIDLVYEDDYLSASHIAYQLPTGYGQVDEIREYILIAARLDETPRSKYESVMQQLSDIKFADSRLQEHLDNFQEEVDSLNLEYQKDLKQANAIDTEIVHIGDGFINNIQLSDTESIRTARKHYTACSDEVRKLVRHESYLKQAESQIILLEKVQSVIDRISAIGEVTLSSKTAIESAQSAYNDLSPEEQIHVSNIDMLNAAQNKLQNLTAAQSVIDQINNIGKVNSYSGQGIYAAENAYNNLSDEAKKYVTNYNKLKSAKDNFESLQNSSGDSEPSDGSGYGTYYWVSGGKVYHVSKNCPTLKRSSNIHSGSSCPSGRRACKVCA